MNSFIVFALLVAGTQAGFLHQPALYAAPLPLAAAPIYAGAPSFNTPLHTVYDSDLTASEFLGATGRAAILPAAVPFSNNGGINILSGAYSHHYAAPSYGYAVRK